MGKIDKHYLQFNKDIDKEAMIKQQFFYILSRTINMFKYYNLPDTVPGVELEKMLQICGNCVFFKHDDNYYVAKAGLGGVLDVYGSPTSATISIPYLNYSETLEIEKECILIKNDTFSQGLKHLVHKYIELLIENKMSVKMAIINTRIQTLLSANDENTVESAKMFLSNIENGKMGVVAEQRLFDSLKVHNTNTTTNLKDLIEIENYYKASMYHEIGLGSNNNMKKERLIGGEIEANDDILTPLIDDFLRCRQDAVDQINKLFNLNIVVELANVWKDRRMRNGVDNIVEELEQDKQEAISVVEIQEQELCQQEYSDIESEKDILEILIDGVVEDDLEGG